MKYKLYKLRAILQNALEKGGSCKLSLWNSSSEYDAHCILFSLHEGEGEGCTISSF